MIVVQHQDEILLKENQVVQQSTGEYLSRRQGDTVQRCKHIVEIRRKHTVQRFGQTGDEDGQIIVMFVQR